MTDPDELRFAHDPALRTLHEEIIKDDPSDDEAVNDLTAPLASALDSTMLSPVVQDYLDALLKPGENPSPELRQRLVRAAARGIDHQRRENTPVALPILLSERRREAGSAPEALANLIQIPVDDLLKLESGAIEVREASSDMIIAWATALEVPSMTTVAALRRALELTAHAPAARAAGRLAKRGLSDADRQLLAEVAVGLGLDPEEPTLQ